MSDKFQCIHTIDPNDPQTWEGKIFLTFDVDWAADAVIDHTIDLLEENQIPATWFITHQSDACQRLIENDLFETGIHPNFNPLLNGDDSKGKTAEEVIDRLLDFVPNPLSARSHSMTQSTGLQNLFKTKGLQFDCNHFIPEHTGIALKPWHLWNGLIKVPYCWEDDVAALYNVLEKGVEHYNGLKVIDFHPIHIFLNTENMDRYEKTRAIHQNPEELIKHRNTDTTGAQTVLKELIKKHQ